MADKKPETITEKQSRARILYERDKLSMREVALQVGKSERTIANWAEQGVPNKLKGPWIKGILAEKIQERAEKSMLATAQRLGMDSEFFLTKIKALCESKKTGVQDIGLTHAERVIPGLKAPDKLEHDFPEAMLEFFQGAE